MSKSKKKVPLIYGTDPEGFAAYKMDRQLYTLPPYWFRKVLGVDSYVEEKDIHGKHPVFFEEDEFKLIEDGAAFEMTIKPSHSPKELWDRIQECARITNERILSQFPDDCLPILRFLPTIGFDVKRWESMPEDFFMSTMFGCDPSQDAWNFHRTARVVDASKHPYRYGGGHIHISGSKMIEDEPILTIRSLSITAAMAAIAFSSDVELEKIRTFEYGFPGNYRIQRYGKNNPFGKDYRVGVEYRTLSNSWCSDWGVAEKVFKWVKIGIENVLEGGLHVELLEVLGEPAQEALLSANIPMATQILSYVESKI